MKTVERNLTEFEAHCLPNHHDFEAYDFSDFVYGERIIRTKDGQRFALLTLDDMVVQEVGRLLDEIYLGKLDEIEIATHFDQVFGFTCDPLEGSGLDASVGIVCPVCKSSQISHRDFIPPRFKVFMIPVISHEHWSSRNQEQRRSIMEQGLRSKGLL
jgi:hypothetical protein